MQYKIVKGLTGQSIKYKCDKCKLALRSPLTDAGKRDSCPTCKAVFMVPGQKELGAFNADREARNQAAGEAKKARAEEKHQRRLEREHTKADADKEAAEQRRLQADVNQRHEQESLQREMRLRNALQGLSFDESTHDWSTSAPWVYECVEVGTQSAKWESQLRAILNSRACKGWEYYRSESLTAERPNGCLAALVGNPTTAYSVVVLVFRRPSSVVRREQEITSQH